MRLSVESMRKILHLTLQLGPVERFQSFYLPSGGVGLRVDSAVYPGYNDSTLL